MSGLGKFVYVAQWIGAVIFPPALFFLQAVLFGGGWNTVFGMVVFLPMILLGLVPPLLTVFDRPVRASRTTRPWYSVVTLLLWVFFLLATLTKYDAGDGPRFPSILSGWAGMSFDVSTNILMVSLYAVLVLYVVSLILAIAGIASSRRAARAAKAASAA